MEQSEPSTGEIVRALRNCSSILCGGCSAHGDASHKWCGNNELADRLESQERTIADKDAKIAELTARAEQAERDITMPKGVFKDE